MILPTIVHLALLLLPLSTAACNPNLNDLQTALNAGGAGFVLSLCKGQTYDLTSALQFTAADQEISTEGYPTGDDRAKLVVTGNGQTTAIKGVASGLDRCKLKNLQVDGNRGGAAPPQNSEANIEMGGDNTGQLIENIKTANPRGWSCLHIQEGSLKCSGVTIQNNQIGPCGVSTDGQWADGISLSCQNSLVQNNDIVDATDGAIVIFGAPGSTIKNNRIVSQTQTLLGGINLVDTHPWLPEGTFAGTVVENNQITGEFATGAGDANRGPNEHGAIIKVGIAIGPRVWSGNAAGSVKSSGGTVQSNTLTGAFAFGIAVGNVQDFTIKDNVFHENVAFIGEYGPTCPQDESKPNLPTALLKEPGTLSNVNILDGGGDAYNFVDGSTTALVCFKPPAANSNSWPYGQAPGRRSIVNSRMFRL